MYFVDRKKINEHLVYMNELLSTFETMSIPKDRVNVLAVERIGHLLIESMMDVGNMIIDGFIMRDPGSFEDILDILIDEKVLPSEEAGSLKKVVNLRKSLVQDYPQADVEQIYKTIKRYSSELSVFSDHVKRYLENELGPVSAFLPE
ncbi:DUF86 domain-containing protein [Fictibacillus phosphorivorans]|uniref:DUF86 domain-containing protein n=1 Tax=Fictibacillus phosphorivorans TaxID=1221500 RepID=UPI00203E3E5C|nr:DUF86 domain-containing protein [Fictibacillus phosphorivorans]MCM3718787.1 DUF86 domain-containing protein [Fictibacillus phosphorivorans]MCM3776410.1 DUF86 domain-containing protein [Fictibacillus phosphorivorans]